MAENEQAEKILLSLRSELYAEMGATEMLLSMYLGDHVSAESRERRSIEWGRRFDIVAHSLI